MSQIQKARKALSNFCKGKQTLSIPPLSDDDDIVIAAALNDLGKLQADRDQLKVELEKLDANYTAVAKSRAEKQTKILELKQQLQQAKAREAGLRGALEEVLKCLDTGSVWRVSRAVDISRQAL